MKMSIRIITFFILLISSMNVVAQEDQLGNWIMYFGQNRIHDKWSIHSEVQYRNHTVAPNIEQLLLRTGLRHHFTKNFAALIGYGFIPSYDLDAGIGNPRTKEHRIYQEFIITQVIGRLNFEHRYRIEQRWVEKDYRSRFRYRLFFTIPLNHATMEDKTVFLAFYDELFVNGKKTFFDRNRLYGALGYRFNSKTNVQFGLLNQQVNDFDKWYLQFAVIFNPDLRKSK